MSATPIRLNAPKVEVRQAEKLAVEIIREHLDAENAFDAEATYGIQGKNLKTALAYAYLRGSGFGIEPLPRLHDEPRPGKRRKRS